MTITQEGAMFEAITAWATIAIAIGTLASVYVAYRGIKSQAQSFANSVSADLALKLLHDFDSEENRKRRSRVADSLLKKIKLAEVDDLFDLFESIGLFVRRGLLDPDVAHSFFFHWVNLYWVAGKHIVEEKRKASADLWCDFELLYKSLLTIEMARDARSRYINPSDDLIRECLEEELE
jgi:cbb3-type cytochrome oxidase subunit 3